MESNFIVVQTYSEFNPKRFSNPWLAILTKNGVSFDYHFVKGAWTGDASGGDLVGILDDGQIIAWGRKDNRGGKHTTQHFGIVVNGKINEVSKAELVKIVN